MPVYCSDTTPPPSAARPRLPEPSGPMAPAPERLPCSIPNRTADTVPELPRVSNGGAFV